MGVCVCVQLCVCDCVWLWPCVCVCDYVCMCLPSPCKCGLLWLLPGELKPLPTSDAVSVLSLLGPDEEVPLNFVSMVKGVVTSGVHSLLILSSGKTSAPSDLSMVDSWEASVEEESLSVFKDRVSMDDLQWFLSSFLKSLADATIHSGMLAGLDSWDDFCCRLCSPQTHQPLTSSNRLYQ